jgi:hypothetical protein
LQGAWQRLRNPMPHFILQLFVAQSSRLVPPPPEL